MFIDGNKKTFCHWAKKKKRGGDMNRKSQSVFRKYLYIIILYEYNCI